IQYDRHPGNRLEFFQQAVVQWIRLFGNDLNPARSVDMYDCRNLLFCRFLRIEGNAHKGGSGVLRQVFPGAALSHRGTERTAELAKLDNLIDTIPRFDPTRVGKDRAAAQRSRTGVHPALKPSDHQSSVE